VPPITVVLVCVDWEHEPDPTTLDDELLTLPLPLVSTRVSLCTEQLVLLVGSASVTSAGAACGDWTVA